MVLFASSGNATTTHVSAELFKVMTGTDMVHVPFRGSVFAVADLMAAVGEQLGVEVIRRDAVVRRAYLGDAHG